MMLANCNEEKMEQKKLELEELFNCKLTLTNDFTLEHYSHYGAEGISLFNNIGIKYYKLLSVHLSISADLNAEQNWDENATSIRTYIYSTLSQKLASTRFYAETKFGNGVTETEKYSSSMLLTMLGVLTGKLITLGNFESMYHGYKSYEARLQLRDNFNYKTKLSELAQKLYKKYPEYKLISKIGPQHDLKFNVQVKVGNKIFCGEGQSKKKAEIDAASNAFITLRKHFKFPELKVTGLSYTIAQTGVNKSKVNWSPRLYSSFKLPKSTELIPDLIHPRFKKQGYWLDLSHRPLAMLGAYILDFLISLYAYQLFLGEQLTENSCGDIARLVISNSNLSKIYSQGFFRFQQLPFKSNELELENYKVDCVQAMVSISYLHHLDDGNLENFFETDIAKWLYKRSEFVAAKKSPDQLRSNPTSIALERYQAFGVLFEFSVFNRQVSVLLTQVNQETDQEFEFNPNVEQSTVREQKQQLGMLLLKAIDYAEAVGLVGTEKKANELIKLCQFLDNGMIQHRKNYASLNGIKVAPIRIDSLKEFENESYKSLVSLWNNSSEFTVEQKVELLIRLRMYLGINNSIEEAKEFCYLPIIFDAIHENSNSKSVIDFKKLDNELIELEFDQINSKDEIEDSGMLEKVNTPIVKGRLTKKVSKSTPINHISKADTKLLDDIPVRIAHLVESLKDKRESYLEYKWKNRDDYFEYKEEAAIYLAQLRFVKGIDYKLQNYRIFLDTDMVTKLKLPSIYPAKKIEPSSSIKNKIPISAKGNFKLEESDERKYVQRNMAVRKGRNLPLGKAY